jgi:hypothetical protein
MSSSSRFFMRAVASIRLVLILFQRSFHVSGWSWLEPNSNTRSKITFRQLRSQFNIRIKNSLLFTELAWTEFRYLI